MEREINQKKMIFDFYIKTIFALSKKEKLPKNYFWEFINYFLSYLQQP
ncbi:hypothetical protein ACSVH2_04690 [Flavobacterium sp. RSB2_4_14]